MNIINFLDRHRIEHAPQGKDRILIHCPFCGESDPSMHMVVRLSDGAWKCWRNPQRERGRDPTKLVQALLGCTWDEARRITGQTSASHGLAGKDVSDYVRGAMMPEIPTTDKRDPLLLTYPRIRPGSSSRAVRYMQSRGFTDDEIFFNDFDLRFTIGGAFKDRIVFPVYCAGLVTWTGRSIYPTALPRYKTLTTDAAKAREEGTPLALKPITDTLLNFDRLWPHPRRLLVICEGPFDAFNVQTKGGHKEIDATCIFGLGVSFQQIVLLEKLIEASEDTMLLLDNDQPAESLRIHERLKHLGVKMGRVPVGRKDPGEMSRAEVVRLLD